MTAKPLITCVLLLLAGLAIAPATLAQADAADSAAAPLPPDIRLVIDVSGSMKRNDPNNLRQPAVELLVQLLPEQSRAGVWTFGKWINMLVPHKPVTQQWREVALDKAKAINSVGLYTNIGEALEKAAYDLESVGNDYRTSIILLTDGMVDIDKSPDLNKREWRRIADEVLPKLKDAGITIHTIALSDNADKNLMSKLSLSTNGMAEVAHTADDLMRIFLKAFDAAAPAEQVPLTDNQFVIDSSVEEFTALIFRKNPAEQTELVGPDKAVYSVTSEDKDVKWHRADKYDLITVRQPLEGEWGVKAEMDPESRVTVVSNLNLRVKPLPLNVFKGQQEDLSLFLQEDGKTITRKEFLKLMDINAAMEAGNDEFDLQEFWRKRISGESPPDDGKYQHPLPVFDKGGIYQLNVIVDGKTFIRQFNHQFHVRQPFGAEVKQLFEEGKTEYVLIANSYNQSIDIPRTQVVATIITPENRKKIRPLKATDVDTWKANLLPDVEGEYQAIIKAKGFNSKGEEFEVTLDAITFNYSLDGGFTEEKAPFFEATATPEITPTPSPQPEDSTESAAEAPDQAPAKEGVPSWLLYTILGVGNLLLFALGYFAFKKIMGKNDDILQQFSEEKVAEQIETPPPPPEPEPEPVPEEEPPMEDLEPAMEDLAQPDTNDEMPPPDDMSQDDLESDSEDLEDLDDLDAMTADEEDVDNELEAEDDEMVAEMLKAQGLDLAEDELDEAISTLIDDLDAQGEDDEDEDESEPKN